MKKVPYAKGKRSIVYKTIFNGKEAIVKEERKDSGAIERINNEIKWLKKLNKVKVGPKILEEGEGYMICEFVEGERILEFMKHAKKADIRKVMLNVLDQCRVMDRMLVSKEEMHNPWKHIIIGKDVKMIDFERCHNTERPKNVTQFSQFIISKRVSIILKEKGIMIDKEKIIANVKQYKNSYDEKSFKSIKKLI